MRGKLVSAFSVVLWLYVYFLIRIRTLTRIPFPPITRRHFEMRFLILFMGCAFSGAFLRAFFEEPSSGSCQLRIYANSLK